MAKKVKAKDHHVEFILDKDYVDVMSVWLDNRVEKSKGCVARTLESKCGRVFVDLDKNGKPLAVEILF